MAASVLLLEVAAVVLVAIVAVAIELPLALVVIIAKVAGISVNYWCYY